jgi:hypothetical protein
VVFSVQRVTGLPVLGSIALLALHEVLPQGLVWLARLAHVCCVIASWLDSP